MIPQARDHEEMRKSRRRLPAGYREGRGELSHGVQADHVSLGVEDEGDVAVFADGEFRFHDLAADLRRAGGFGGAVGAGEVDEGAAGAGIFAGQVDEGAGATGGFEHGEGPHLDLGAFEMLEGNSEGFFVEGFRAVHVLNVDFEPADGIARYAHGVWCVEGLTVNLIRGLNTDGQAFRGHSLASNRGGFIRRFR